MTPRFSANYSVDMIAGHSILFGEKPLKSVNRTLQSLLFVSASYFNNLFIFKFCRRVFLSVHIWASSLRNHISLIFGICSKPQMMRINARWIIAMMQNPKIVCNLSEFYPPRNTVSGHDHSVNPELSVSLAAAICRPFPAFMRPCFSYLRPKSYKLIFREFDLLAGVRELCISFIHKFLYVEVRARDTVRSVLALDHFNTEIAGMQQ